MMRTLLRRILDGIEEPSGKTPSVSSMRLVVRGSGYMIDVSLPETRYLISGPGPRCGSVLEQMARVSWGRLRLAEDFEGLARDLTLAMSGPVILGTTHAAEISFVTDERVAGTGLSLVADLEQEGPFSYRLEAFEDGDGLYLLWF